MDEHERGRQGGRRRSLRSAGVALFILVLAAGPVAACAGDAGDAAMWTAMPTMHGGVPTVDPGRAPDAPLAAADAMWAAKPAYVSTTTATEAAYHYAIDHPDIVKWMPCYCGCEAMGHSSNLACYVKPDGATFDEHASYCDICVQITLKTKALVEQGMPLTQIRQVIDDTWGGLAPGTPTELPPV